jgi:glutamate carboxypeptidase
MKAGLVIIEFAFEAIRELRRTTRRPVLVVLTTDEEVGSPAGRPCVERMSQGAACALVLEPSLPGGAVKTARKGVGRFDLFIQGRAAHAGLNPEQGVSAVIELARKLLEIDQLANSSLGTTLTVGTIRGGTATNVVPAESAASIDARVWSLAEASRVESALRSLRPDDPRASLRIEGRWNRPPMERTPASEALFEEARGIAGRLGQTLIEGSAGGGSDGNFTAALGIPTLDGLGAEGDGAHADHEYIIIDSLPDRAALLASLLCEL